MNSDLNDLKRSVMQDLWEEYSEGRSIRGKGPGHNELSVLEEQQKVRAAE